MPCPEKFMESMTKFALDDSLIRQINDGCEDLISRSAVSRKREYFKRAMALLDQQLSNDTLTDLMDFNACCRARSSRERASRAFAREHAAKTMAERLALIPSVSYMGIPSLTDDGKLYVLAIQYAHDDAYHCTCPSINTRKKSEIPLSRSYCRCCAGHFRFHYQIMLGCELRLDHVASSPLDTQGREPCAFVFRFLSPVR